VEESVYLGAVIHSTTQSTPDILRRTALNLHSNAELGQAALAVKNLTLNETEALQQLYTANFLIWFRMLCDHQGGCMQDQCSPPVVPPCTPWNQMVPLCLQRGSTMQNQSTITH